MTPLPPALPALPLRGGRGRWAGVEGGGLYAASRGIKRGNGEKRRGRALRPPVGPLEKGAWSGTGVVGAAWSCPEVMGHAPQVNNWEQS